MITPEAMQGEVEATLGEWLDGTYPEFDETATGKGVRQHRVELKDNGVWCSYPLEDPNDKTYWEFTVHVRRVS